MRGSVSRFYGTGDFRRDRKLLLQSNLTMADAVNRRRSRSEFVQGVEVNEPKKSKPKGKPQDFQWDIYNNLDILAKPGWEEQRTPWTALIATRYVNWVHVDRAFWPRDLHERNCVNASAKWTQISNIPIKWRMLSVLRAISDDPKYAKHNIPLCIVAMVYAESVLKVQVDWSSLPSYVRQAYLVRRPKEIPMVPIPQWFIENHDLLYPPKNYSGPSTVDDMQVDEELLDEVIANLSIPAFVEVPRQTPPVQIFDGEDENRGSAVETEAVATGAPPTEEADAAMPDFETITTDVIMDDTVLPSTPVLPGGEGFQGINVAPSTLDGTHVHGRVIGDLIRKHETEVAALRARVTFLEGKLAELGFKEDASNADSMVWSDDFVVPVDQSISSVPPPECMGKGKEPMTSSQLWKYEERVAAMNREDKLQYERDAALDCIATTESLAGEVMSRNLALEKENEELKKK